MNPLDAVEHFVDRIEGSFHNHRLKQKHEFLRLTTLKLQQGNNGATDSNGNLSLQVYQNTSGRKLVIGRVLVWADGYTPSSPYTGTGYLAISSMPDNAAQIKDYAPYTNAESTPWLPNVAEYSGLNGLRYEQNESVWIQIFGGPTSTNITATVWGFLEPIDSDFEI